MAPAYFFGRLFGIYFIIYPIIFFGWNYSAPFFSAPLIPDFWAGMFVFFLLRITINSFKKFC